jgi:nitrite reductase (NO-forming)
MRNVLAVVLVVGAVAVPTALAAPRTSSVVVVSAAKSGLRYSTKTLHAKAGRIEIVFHNPSALPHNVRIELGESELGGTRTVTHGTAKAFVTLKHGTYHFYCSVPGHEDAGMSGSLVVS